MSVAPNPPPQSVAPSPFEISEACQCSVEDIEEMSLLQSESELSLFSLL